MPSVRNTPCGWVPDLTGCNAGPCCPGTTTFDPDIAALASDVAAQILWALSGRILGCCEITVRPCRRRDCDQLPLAELVYWDGRNTTNLGVGMGFTPLLLADGIHNITCGCVNICTCEAACEWLLPGPVCDITEILVDGAAVPSADYAVFDYNKLIFLDSATCPPSCQNFGLPAGAPGTWSVTYTVGLEVTSAANLAAGQYACELARALTGDPNCRLPRNVQSVARQGIDIAFADPFALAEAGLTGLPSVDLWLRAVNPAHLAERPYVWSPDLSRARRQTS